MNKATKILSLVMALLMTVLLCACGSKDRDNHDSSTENTEGEKTTLTERQIQILRDNGMPEDYDSLTDLQKSAITAIEKCLTHLEDTYHKEFVYNGYVPAGGVDPEYVTAYAKDDPMGRIVTVYRKYDGNKFIYHDDYLEISSVDAYKAALEEHFSQILPKDNIWFYVTINQITDSDEDILVRAGATTVAFVKDTFESKDEVRKLMEDYGSWMSSLNPQHPTGMILYVQNEQDYAETNQFNYSRMIHGGRHEYHFICSINGSGEVDIS